MIHFLVRFLLSLCVLLLSEYSQLYAYPSQECNSTSFIKTSKESEQARLEFIQHDQPLIISSSPAVTERENAKINAAEIVEEDYISISFKKYLESSHFFTALFYALTFGYCCRFIKTCLPSCKHSIYFSSYKWYLIFRVIRL